jgi:hypothetical protein
LRQFKSIQLHSMNYKDVLIISQSAAADTGKVKDASSVKL